MEDSKHYHEDRRQREAMIRLLGGDGNVIRKMYKQDSSGRYCWRELTDNGIIIVRNTKLDKVVTKIIATPKQVEEFYPMRSAIPQDLKEKVKRNNRMNYKKY